MNIVKWIFACGHVEYRAANEPRFIDAPCSVCLLDIQPIEPHDAHQCSGHCRTCAGTGPQPTERIVQ